MIVYTTESCAPCRSLKHFLDNKGVKYTALDADQEPHYTTLIKLLNGPRIVPTVVIEGFEPISGLNYPRLTKVLKEAGLIQ